MSATNISSNNSKMNAKSSALSPNNSSWELVETDQIKYVMRPMEAKDVPTVLEMWAADNLYEGSSTMLTYMEIDPKGFWVAVEPKTDTIYGCCGGVIAHPDTGFVGMYVVDARYRGKGIGSRLFQKVMDHFGNMNVGLYSLEKHLPTYRDKAGFKVQDSVNVIVYETSDKVDWQKLTPVLDHVAVRYAPNPNESDLFEQLMEYDESIVLHRREKLLALSLQERDSMSRVAIDEHTGKIIGYGKVRKDVTDKLMCGPLYAERDDVAELLLRHLLAMYGDHYQGITLMVPDCTPGGYSLAKKLDLPNLYSLPRLFTKHLPKAKMTKIYSIFSPNFYPF